MTGWVYEFTGHALASFNGLPPEQRQDLKRIATSLAREADVDHASDPEYGSPAISKLLIHPEGLWVVSYQLDHARRHVYIVQVVGG